MNPKHLKKLVNSITRQDIKLKNNKTVLQLIKVQGFHPYAIIKLVKTVRSKNNVVASTVDGWIDMDVRRYNHQFT